MMENIQSEPRWCQHAIKTKYNKTNRMIIQLKTSNKTKKRDNDKSNDLKGWV